MTVGPRCGSTRNWRHAWTPPHFGRPPFAEACADDFGSWGTFAQRGVPAGVAELALWVPSVVPRLAELEARWEKVTAGTCLLHGDLRVDNMLITGTVSLASRPIGARGAPSPAPSEISLG